MSNTKLCRENQDHPTDVVEEKTEETLLDLKLQATTNVSNICSELNLLVLIKCMIEC